MLEEGFLQYAGVLGLLERKLAGGKKATTERVLIFPCADEVEVRQREREFKRYLRSTEVFQYQGKELWILPKHLLSFPGGSDRKLSAVSWFKKSVAGLAGNVKTAALTAHVDLRRAFLAAQSGGLFNGRDLLPNLEGILDVGMSFHAASADTKSRLQVFFRLARSPVGIAAAFDRPALAMKLAPLLGELPENAAYVIHQFRVAALIDGIKARLSGEMSSVLPNAQMLLGMMKGPFQFLLNHKFWRAFGDEWAFVDPEGKLQQGRDFMDSGAMLLAEVVESETLGAGIEAFADFGAAAAGLDIQMERIGKGRVFRSKFRGDEFVLVIGQGFLGLGPGSAASRLLALLEREASTAKAKSNSIVPLLRDGEQLLGFGNWNLKFKSLRVEGGILLDGSW